MNTVKFNSLGQISAALYEVGANTDAICRQSRPGDHFSNCFVAYWSDSLKNKTKYTLP